MGEYAAISIFILCLETPSASTAFLQPSPVSHFGDSQIFTLFCCLLHVMVIPLQSTSHFCLPTVGRKQSFVAGQYLANICRCTTFLP